MPKNTIWIIVRMVLFSYVGLKFVFFSPTELIWWKQYIGYIALGLVLYDLISILLPLVRKKNNY